MEHSILIAVWHMLTNDVDDADLGGDYFAQLDPQRAMRRIVRQANALGFTIRFDPGLRPEVVALRAVSARRGCARRCGRMLGPMADDFSLRYGDLLTGSYDCVDRIVLNRSSHWGISPAGYAPGGGGCTAASTPSWATPI